MRAQPGDLVMHEGALENSGSVLLQLRVPIPVIDGLQSNLAYGATFPEARGIFWDAPRAREAWAKPGRHFLISVVAADRSVVRSFPLDRVIPGWGEAIGLMTVGEVMRVWIPESLAYQGKVGMPAGMLIFDIELLGFTPAQ